MTFQHVHLCLCNIYKPIDSSHCPLRRLHSSLRAAQVPLSSPRRHSDAPVSTLLPSTVLLFRHPLDVYGGSRNEGSIDSFSLLFCWQPSITPVRPPTSNVTMGTASPRGGHVTVTWIAKMVLMRIRPTVVSTNTLALTRSFTSVCCSGRGNRWSRK